MIELTRPIHKRSCNMCYVQNETVKELNFKADYNGIVVALCKNCRKTLWDMLTKDLLQPDTVHVKVELEYTKEENETNEDIKKVVRGNIEHCLGNVLTVNITEEEDEE